MDSVNAAIQLSRSSFISQRYLLLKLFTRYPFPQMRQQRQREGQRADGRLASLDCDVKHSVGLVQRQESSPYRKWADAVCNAMPGLHLLRINVEICSYCRMCSCRCETHDRVLCLRRGRHQQRVEDGRFCAHCLRRCCWAHSAAAVKCDSIALCPQASVKDREEYHGCCLANPDASFLNAQHIGAKMNRRQNKNPRLQAHATLHMPRDDSIDAGEAQMDLC